MEYIFQILVSPKELGNMSRKANFHGVVLSCPTRGKPKASCFNSGVIMLFHNQ